MTFVPYPTATMLIESGPVGQKHLFIVMTNPCSDGQHLLLNVSSIKDGKSYDPTCTFQGGEHEFITSPSFIEYRHADRRPASLISKCIGSGLFVLKNDLDQTEFDRVVSGIYKSEFIKPWAESYFDDNKP